MSIQRSSIVRKTQLTLAGLLVFLLNSSLVIGQPATSQKPNVIFILADDLGYGDLGCFGQKLIKTPNIDRLAKEGTRFTQAYAGATVCAPSRCSLMTGKHNGHAAIRGNQEVQPEGQVPMPSDTFTVGHLMKLAGYKTGLIGKWGLGHPGSTSTPDKMGFDYFFGYNCQRKAHEYYPEYLWRNDQQVMLNGKEYSHDLMAQDALDFVRKNKDNPFYLYLAFTIPHSKLQVPDTKAYDDETWPDNLKKLASMVTRLDSDVGRLMSLLKELSIDDKTMVIFASDNGAAYQDELFQHSGPLRGFKRDMYEGGIRTPAIVRFPSRVPAGVVNEQVWTFADFLPTMSELTSVKLPGEVDGVSVWQSWLSGKAQEHPPIYFEFHERGFNQAARIGNWKAVKMSPTSPLELYDLQADPSEKNDLALKHPDEVQRFESFLKSARTESAIWPIRPAKAKPAAQRQANQKAAAQKQSNKKDASE